MSYTNNKLNTLRRLLLGELYDKCKQDAEGVSSDDLQEQLRKIQKDGDCLHDCDWKDLAEMCQMKTQSIPSCFSEENDRKCMDSYREKEWKQALKNKKQEIINAYNAYVSSRYLENYPDVDDEEEEEEEEKAEIECSVCGISEAREIYEGFEKVGEEELKQMSCGHYAHVNCLIELALKDRVGNAKCPMCRKIFSLNEVPVPQRSQEEIQRDSMFIEFDKLEAMGFITREQRLKREEEYNKWMNESAQLRKRTDMSKIRIDQQIGYKYQQMLRERNIRETIEYEERVQREMDDLKKKEYEEYDTLEKEGIITKDQRQKMEAMLDEYEKIVRNIMNEEEISNHKKAVRIFLVFEQMKQKQREMMGYNDEEEKKEQIHEVKELIREIVNSTASMKERILLYQELTAKIPSKYLYELDDVEFGIDDEVFDKLREDLASRTLTIEQNESLNEIQHHLYGMKRLYFAMPIERAIRGMDSSYIESFKNIVNGREQDNAGAHGPLKEHIMDVLSDLEINSQKFPNFGFIDLSDRLKELILQSLTILRETDQDSAEYLLDSLMDISKYIYLKGINEIKQLHIEFRNAIDQNLTGEDPNFNWIKIALEKLITILYQYLKKGVKIFYLTEDIPEDLRELIQQSLFLLQDSPLESHHDKGNELETKLEDIFKMSGEEWRNTHGVPVVRDYVSESEDSDEESEGAEDSEGSSDESERDTFEDELEMDERIVIFEELNNLLRSQQIQMRRNIQEDLDNMDIVDLNFFLQTTNENSNLADIQHVLSRINFTQHMDEQELDLLLQGIEYMVDNLVTPDTRDNTQDTKSLLKTIILKLMIQYKSLYLSQTEEDEFERIQRRILNILNDIMAQYADIIPSSDELLYSLILYASMLQSSTLIKVALTFYKNCEGELDNPLMIQLLNRLPEEHREYINRTFNLIR